MSWLQIPEYSNEDLAHRPLQLIAYNDAALMLWSERYHLAAIDWDEFYSAQPKFQTVDSWFNECMPGADVIGSYKITNVCEECVFTQTRELDFFDNNWDPQHPTDILESFSQTRSPNPEVKSIMWPDKVGQVWVLAPSGREGAQFNTTNIQQAPDPNGDAFTDCILIVHLYNLFSARVGYEGRWAHHRIARVSRAHMHAMGREILSSGD